MTDGADLTLGVLFLGKVDASFRRETDKLRDILMGLSRQMSSSTSSMGGATKKARAMGDEFSNVGKKISKVSGGFQRLTAALKVTASYGLAGTFLFGVINSLKQGVVEIANFDQSLKNLQAITGATSPEIMALRDVILDVAERTRYSAGEISEAAVTLGQAGFSASESLDVLNAVANLSTGTLSNMADVSDLITTALRSFGESAQQAGRYSDIFASAINRSKLNVDKLRTAFNYLGPIASQVGLDLENTAAGAMVLANAGLRGSTIGTGFRRVLQLLVSPTKKLRVLFASAGADLDKLNPAVSSMTSVIGELQKLLGKTVDPAERARRAFELFGLRGASVAAALGQAGREGFEAMLSEVYAVGRASEMAEKQMEGLATMAKNLKDRFVNLAIAIGEGGIADALRIILPILRTSVSVITDLANTIFGQAVVAFTTLTLVIATLRIGIRYLIIQLTALAAGMSVATIQRYAAAHGLLAVAFQGVTRAAKSLFLLLKTNPWFLAATAISAVAVATYSWNKRQREIIPTLQKQGVHLDQNISKLNDFQIRLSRSNEGSMEYRATLERLIQEFPELATQIDLVNGKFLDQGESLEKLINKFRVLRLENLADMFSAYVDRIADIEKKIKAYEDLLQRGEKDRPFVERYTDRINKLKKELNDLVSDQRAAFSRIGDVLLDLGLTTTSSFEQIKDKVIEVFGLSQKEADKLATYIQGYYDRIRLLKLKSMQDDKNLAASQEDLVSIYGDKWLALYRKLDALRRADLLETVYDMQEKVTKLEQLADKQGWTEEQLQARIRELNEETYRTFIEKETAKARKARKTAAEIKEAYLQANNELEASEIASARARAADRSQRIKESVNDANKRKSLLITVEETLNKEIFKIKEKYKRKEEDLIDDISKFRLKSESESVEAAIAEAKKKAEALKRQVEDEISQAELKASLLLDIEAALQKEIERIRQEFADKDVGSRKEKLRNLEEEYRAGIITVKEYYEELDRLAELNLISDTRRAEQKRKIQENIWDALVNGFEDASRRVLSWSEMLYNIGETIADKIADDLTSSILEFADGTKTAEQAFRDFAKSVIDWLAKMIIKQTLLNALNKSFGLGGGGGGSTYDTSWISVNKPHSGGVVGSKLFARKQVDPSLFNYAPRLHGGLRKDEYPAILQKGEEVTPKSEVGKNKEVQVIINEAPPGTTAREDNSGADVKKIIIDVAAQDFAGGGTLDKLFSKLYGLKRVTTRR